MNKLKTALQELEKVKQGYMPTKEGAKLINQISYLKCLLSVKENSEQP